MTVHISGGLGNQMFQYAAARALALSTGAEVALDLSFYGNLRKRRYELEAFDIVAAPRQLPPQGLRRLFHRKSTAAGPQFPLYREPHFRFDPAFRELTSPVRLEGHFQSPRYFEGYAAEIRRELAPPAATDSESRAVAEAIMATDAAWLHVRRGDYVSRPHVNAIHGTCSIGYYEQALEQLPAESTVFVFSDDIPWARANLPRLRELVFVGGSGRRSGLADLWLMTLAQHRIVANSSFSWWGAWLGRPGGVTVAPQPWFTDPALDDADLVPADWIRIER